METRPEDLAPRQRALLRAVVLEYISAAEPVPSERLSANYELGVKSATVRNELAQMAEMGYLEQPHTSSGRIPTDLGYRYFVDHLAIRRDPGERAKDKVQSATEDGELLESLLRDTTRVLSRLTHLLSAAALVRDASLKVKSALVSALGPHQALLVVVLSNGTAESRVLECPLDMTIEDVGQANQVLAREAVDKALKCLVRSKPPSTPGNAGLERLMSAVWATLRAIANERTSGALVTEGEEFLFAQPEFKRDADTLAKLIDAIKSENILYEAMSSADSTESVTIGTENRSEQMHRLSVVKHRFFVGQNEAGSIAVIGPTRLEYESSIPLVNFTAKALTDALTKFFG